MPIGQSSNWVTELGIWGMWRSFVFWSERCLLRARQKTHHWYLLESPAFEFTPAPLPTHFGNAGIRGERSLSVYPLLPRRTYVDTYKARSGWHYFVLRHLLALFDLQDKVLKSCSYCIPKANQARLVCLRVRACLRVQCGVILFYRHVIIWYGMIWYNTFSSSLHCLLASVRL